ncbi:MAG: excinuclease ABC subunit UvrC [Myxococcales bacterium]|nr:excinuclease ABC subunit UvrC [Myxococcales bacterium]MCB9522841.1 excinuclease ABC subunit UvrC [Myxococcales bacterium]
MPFDPATDIERLPAEPGVYLMKGKGGEIIYVGKAASLRARVRQYFGATSDTRFFVGLLDEWLEDLDVIVTASAKEALILENELIKRHQPRFNVNLKDDKSFLNIRLDDRVDWPRLQVTRRPKKDGAKYFGPYHSASKIRQTLKLVERHFQLRNCDDLTFKNRSRPCLQYQIKRCPGPCVLPVDKAAYHQQVGEVALFLQGRHGELVPKLEAKMQAAAADMAYERAAIYRDQIKAIQGSLEPQQMVSGREIDRDVLGLYREGSALQVALLQVRRGRMIGAREFSFSEPGTPDEAWLSSFVNQYYARGNPIPDEVLLPVAADEQEALTERLSDLKGKRVVLKVPQRGAGRKLLEMAEKNAETAFFQSRREEAVRHQGLTRLKKTLRLANLPYRMECYDISLFQGAAAVGSQVVFEGGVPKRSAYRHYKIRTVEGTDDFAMMREVLTRRLSRGLEEADLPDLIVIDGGKGQLGVARAVFEDLGIDGVDLVGLAKSRVLDGLEDEDGGTVRSSERVFIPGRSNPVLLKPHTDELFLLTHLRDEAHRFAITFHRKLRQKSTLTSALDEIPGVGPGRRRALLRAFGSVRGVTQASEAQIAAVPGIGAALAATIAEALRGG